MIYIYNNQWLDNITIENAVRLLIDFYLFNYVIIKSADNYIVYSQSKVVTTVLWVI